jgi:hypothetical protein
MTDTATLGVADSLLESAAECGDADSVRALGELQLTEVARSLVNFLAQDANEGQLTPEEARECERIIAPRDIIAALSLKARRRMQFVHG